jgi:hypothetical protein
MEEPPVQPSFYRLDDPFRAFALSRPHRAARKRENPHALHPACPLRSGAQSVPFVRGVF